MPLFSYGLKSTCHESVMWAIGHIFGGNKFRNFRWNTNLLRLLGSGFVQEREEVGRMEDLGGEEDQ